jgi:hypothetical protein
MTFKSTGCKLEEQGSLREAALAGSLTAMHKGGNAILAEDSMKGHALIQATNVRLLKVPQQ